jgi:hypothetical protein
VLNQIDVIGSFPLFGRSRSAEAFSLFGSAGVFACDVDAGARKRRSTYPSPASATMAMDLLRALPLPLLQSDGLVKQEQLVPGLLFDDLAGDANALPCAALFACDDAFPALDEFIASADFDSACGAARRGAARRRRATGELPCWECSTCAPADRAFPPQRWRACTRRTRCWTSGPPRARRAA